LEWDAEADVEAILADFYSRWYGPAAGPMRAYDMALEKALEETPLHGHENTFMAEVYTPELMTKLEQYLTEAKMMVGPDRSGLHVKLVRLIHDHLKAYVAMEAADDLCNYAECLKQAQRMLDLRKEINELSQTPTMMAGEYAYTTEDRMKEYRGWLEKINGEKGELITVLPEKALFRTDPNKSEGFFFGWYQPELNEEEWKPILTTKAQGWADQRGFNYTGMAWYRMWVDVPPVAEGKKVLLLVPGEVEEAWCWVNGEYVGHHPWHSVWWRDFTHEFDVTEQIRQGRRNQITFRVLCNEQMFGMSGIFRRMLLYTPT
jgi:hypothetical protein